MISSARMGTLAVLYLQAMFVTAAAALFFYAVFLGINKQRAIDERKMPDICRAMPARCDIPQHHAAKP